MSAVELTRDEARYLSVLASADIRNQRRAGTLTDQHAAAWAALQPACDWGDGQPGEDPP